MKSALLLSKSPALFEEFGRFLLSLKPDNQKAGNSIKVNGEDGSYFMFYDRIRVGDTDTWELPPFAVSKGYHYAYLVECRSEVLFCRIVGSSPPELDLLVCDNDEKLFRPDELSPNSISL